MAQLRFARVVTVSVHRVSDTSDDESASWQPGVMGDNAVGLGSKAQISDSLGRGERRVVEKPW